MTLEDREPVLGDAAPEETPASVGDEQQTASASPESESDQEALASEPQGDLPDTDASAEGDGEAADDRSFTESFETDYGLKLDKFKSDKAFRDGIAENIRAIGRRDDNAEMGKRLREKFSGKELDSLLSGQPEQEPPADGNGEPPGPDDWDPSWVSFNEKNEPVAAYGAPADVARRYVARQHHVISQFDQILDARDAKILQKVEEINQKSEATDARRQEETERYALVEQHKNLIFIGGDREAGFTGDGERIARLVYENDDWAARCPKELDRLQMAVEFVQGQRPKTKPATAPRKAMRQPGVASAPAEKKSIVELIKGSDGEPGLPLDKAYEAAGQVPE